LEAGQTFAKAVAVLRGAERTRENEIALGIALRYEAQYAPNVGRSEARLPLIRESIAILERVGAMKELPHSKIYAALFLPACDEAECERLLVESLAIARNADCAHAIGWASNLLGQLALRRQDDDRAKAYLQDAVKAFRRIEHRRGLSWVLADLARLACYQGSYAQARALATESMDLCKEIGWSWRVAEQLLFLGHVALAQGAAGEGCTCYERARALAHDIGDDRLLAFAHCGLGDAAVDRQDLDRARTFYRHALERATEDPRPELAWRGVVGLARLAAREGRLEWAVSLLALAQRAVTEPPFPTIDTALRWMDVRLRILGLVAELERQLSSSAFAAAEERGRDMALRATVAELLGELSQGDTRHP
jgi:tetratricopeptide (TPR) repeat protein